MNSRYELRKWLKEREWNIAGTLTFADGTSADEALRRTRNFWAYIDRRLYGNAAKRHNKRCERVNIMEGCDAGHLLHLHAAIAIAADRFDDADKFCDFLTRAWKLTSGVNYICEFKIITNSSGWIDYITKGVGIDNCDTFDVYSSYIAIS
jgi:hypothetical protein